MEPTAKKIAFGPEVDLKGVPNLHAPQTVTPFAFLTSLKFQMGSYLTESQMVVSAS